MSTKAKLAWRGGRRDDLCCAWLEFTTTAGSLDLRSELAALDTLALAYQAPALMDLPDDLRHLATPRLAIVLSELNQRAAAVIGEVWR